MNNSQVAHSWANQTKDKAKGSSFYFDGPVIYSYGAHFPIAAHHTTPSGAAVILFTTRTYGNTTAKHINHTRRAIPGSIPVFNVLDVGDPRNGGRWAIREHGAPDHAANIAHYAGRINEDIENAKRARKYGAQYINTADALIQEHNDYIDVWTIDAPKVNLKSMIPAAELDAINARAAKYEAETEERERKQRERAAADEAEDLALWTAGGDIRRMFYNSEVKLRIKGGKVETSRGADVSTATARRAIGAWQARTIAAGYKLNGFTVAEVFPDHIIIGCHNISAAEIERIAALFEGSKE